MSAKRNIADEILQGMEEAIDYMRGKKNKAITHKVKIPDNIDVRSIRNNLKLSRTEFADRYGFSSRTIQHWEQGDRRPQGAARILLLLLQRDADTIEEILNPRTKKPLKSHQAVISAQTVSRLRSQKSTHKRKAR